MSQHATTLLDEALQLSSEERVELALKLMESVDGEADQGAAQAWALELLDREQRALKANWVGLEWSDVRARILDKISAK